MSVKEKATAPVPSVGADGKQSLCKTNKESIADLPGKGNLQATNNDRTLRYCLSTQDTDCGRTDLCRYLSICGRTKGRKILLYGTARLPCKHGA